MPHVNVTVIGNAPTQEQKSALFSKISNLLVTVLGPTRKLTLVSVRTEPATNWSVGGDEAEDAGLVGVEAVIRTVAGSSVENRARMIRELLSERPPEGGRIDDRNIDDFNLGRRSKTCVERQSRPTGSRRR